MLEVEGPGFRELVASLFADEPMDIATVHRIRTGDIEEWVAALDRSGLFGRDLVAAAEQQWRALPETLLAILLTDADDMTRRRWSTSRHRDLPGQRLIS